MFAPETEDVAPAPPRLRVPLRRRTRHDDRNEGFDILWGRWPRWSELYIYTYAPETRISQLGNLHRVGPGWTFKPVARGSSSLTDFNLALRGQERAAAGVLLRGAGQNRGTLLTSKLLAEVHAAPERPPLGRVLLARRLLLRPEIRQDARDAQLARRRRVFLGPSCCLTW